MASNFCHGANKDFDFEDICHHVGNQRADVLIVLGNTDGGSEVAIMFLATQLAKVDPGFKKKKRRITDPDSPSTKKGRRNAWQA